MLRRSLLLASLLALAACGGNVVVDNGGSGNGGGSTQSGGGQGTGDACQQAKKRLSSCGGPDIVTGACTGSVECAAHCVISLTGCGAFDGTDPAAAAQFGQCLTSCTAVP